jgi:hypothetical protein
MVRVIVVCAGLVVALVLLGPVSASAQTANLETRRVLDGKVTLLLPVAFEVMGNDMLSIKYPAERRPTLVFTNPDGSVNVALNHTQNRAGPDDIPALLDAVTGMFRNLYPSARWYRSEVVQIGGRRFFLLDLRTPAIDTEIRNLMVGTSLDGRLLFITFNVTRELEAAWLAIGEAIIRSIRIAD